MTELADMTERTLADALAAVDEAEINGYTSRGEARPHLLRALWRLAEAARQHIAALPGAAPPKPGITKVNSLFTVFAVLPGHVGGLWYVAATQGDGKHWATWRAAQGDGGLLDYDDGDLFGSRVRAIADLAKRAGVPS